MRDDAALRQMPLLREFAIDAYCCRYATLACLIFRQLRLRDAARRHTPRRLLFIADMILRHGACCQMITLDIVIAPRALPRRAMLAYTAASHTPLRVRADDIDVMLAPRVIMRALMRRHECSRAGIHGAMLRAVAIAR